MKKAVVILSGYFLFSFFVIKMMFPRELTFLDYSNMLFLNTEAFPALQLSKVNFQFIVSFLLLFILLLYFLIQTVTESVSFMGMVMYRYGKFKTVKSRGIYYIYKICILILLAFGITVLFYLIFSRFNLYYGLFTDIISVFLYIVRYFFVIFCIVFLYEIGNISGKSGAHYFILYALYVFMIMIDAIFGMHFIIFSGEIAIEAIALCTTIVIGLLICLLGYWRFLKKGDIL